MDPSYQAIYQPAAGQSFPAEIFVSSTTVTIRFEDETGQQQELHWLGDHIDALEGSTGNWHLHYRRPGNRPELLKISDPALYQAIRYSFRRHRFSRMGWRYRVLNPVNALLATLVVIVTAIIFAYWWLVPVLSEKMVRFFPKKTEVAIGEQLFQSAIAGQAIDQQKTALLNEFYTNLGFTLSYPIQVTVIRDSTVNAYAVPGGHIVVYTGLLDRLEDAGQLAALLSHEAVHVEARHSLRAMFRQFSRKSFLLFIIGSDSRISSFLIGQADALKGLQYSRALETKADEGGIQLLRSVQIPPYGMVSLMELLRKESAGKEPPAFTNTHPIFSNRIAHIKKTIGNYQGTDTLPDKQTELFQAIRQSSDW